MTLIILILTYIYLYNLQIFYVYDKTLNVKRISNGRSSVYISPGCKLPVK